MRPITTHPPTAEQDAAITAFAARQHLALQAGAGSGKTSTLEMLAHRSRKRGRYIAFNKSIVVEAKRRFPGHVTCSTGHALAYRAVGHRFAARLDGPRMSSARLAVSINLRNEERIGTRTISPAAQCAAAQETVLRYCYSADPLITRAHVPWARGIRELRDHEQLIDLVLPLAERMWRDLQNPELGRIRFQPDHYMKMWALTEPRVIQDYLMLDEAQDTNPVLGKVVDAQRRHSQLIMVGDSAQAIYEWRGARDVMADFHGTTLSLSRSFRFGDAISAEANRWLALAGQTLRLTGTPTINSTVTTLDRPTAILCRTNGGAIAEILQLLAEDRRVAFHGNAQKLRSSPTQPAI
jgi:AAA domain